MLRPGAGVEEDDVALSNAVDALADPGREQRVAVGVDAEGENVRHLVVVGVLPDRDAHVDGSHRFHAVDAQGLVEASAREGRRPTTGVTASAATRRGTRC